MCLGSKSKINDFILDRTKIPLTLEHEVLGITTDTKLNFYSHLKQLSKKVANRLNASTRIIPYLDKKQVNLLYNSFFKGQLFANLDFLFQTFINKLQERAIRVVNNDYDFSFNELCEKVNENTIHIKNIHILMTEIFKFLNGLSPPIMSEIFKKEDCPYSLRNPRSLTTNCKSTAKYGIDSIVYKGPQIWKTLPTDLRNSESLSIFKCNIKKLRDINCQCKICKTYTRNVGYVD